MTGCGRWQGPETSSLSQEVPRAQSPGQGWGAACPEQLLLKPASPRTFPQLPAEKSALLPELSLSQGGPSRHPPRSPSLQHSLFLTAEPLAVPMVTGTFLMGPVDNSSVLPCPFPSALFSKKPASSQARLEETNLTPGMFRLREEDLPPPWACLKSG